MWPNFKISTKFQNFDQISKFQPNFEISTKFQNLSQISKFQPFFLITIYMPIKCSSSRTLKWTNSMPEQKSLLLKTPRGSGSIFGGSPWSGKHVGRRKVLWSSEPSLSFSLIAKLQAPANLPHIGQLLSHNDPHTRGSLA